MISLLQISDLEQEKRDLEKQVNELKGKCEQIEKRAQEQRMVEEKKHTEEMQFLKRTNQQLKVEGASGRGIFFSDIFLAYFKFSIQNLLQFYIPFNFFSFTLYINEY
jgi:hypothetical protein